VTIDGWIDALIRRHTSSLTTTEFNRSVRALSSRYVERRDVLASRSPIDSAGKRAAFAAFYAPLHFLTTRLVVQALQPQSGRDLVDLGCGTGVVSAAWALLSRRPASIRGVDRDRWSLAEAQWNWRQLGVAGRVARGDMTTIAEHGPTRGGRSKAPVAWIAGWSVNELADGPRDRLLRALLDAAGRGDTILIIEPQARRATPWWPMWADAFRVAGGRSDDWKFDGGLPAPLQAIDETAGFAREGLSAKSIFIENR